MKLQLRYYGDPILRKKCSSIEKITTEIRSFVNDMIETMDASNGVGLAANQVGKSFSVFVIRPEERTPDGEFVLGAPEVFINPILSDPSDETETMTEGCLSFPGLHVEIARPYSIHVEAIDINGNPISLDVKGFKAREIMHENDHLNGRVFIDRLSPNVRKSLDPILKNIKKKFTSKSTFF